MNYNGAIFGNDKSANICLVRENKTKILRIKKNNNKMQAQHNLYVIKIKFTWNCII